MIIPKVRMTLRISITMLALLAVIGIRALDFDGVQGSAVRIEAAVGSGLEAVYVLPTTEGVSIVYSSSSQQVQWYCYSTLGGGYAQEIDAVREDNVWHVQCRQGDMGYIVEDGDTRHCFWIADYSRHRLTLDGLAVDDADGSCDRVRVAVAGQAAPIPYYGINGRRMELSRELRLTYSTQRFDDDAFAYVTIPVVHELAGIDGSTTVEAPLCGTTFSLEGDRFLRQWGEAVSVESDYYDATAIDATTRAVASDESIDNQIKGSGADGEALGGSAPYSVRFESATSDAVVFTEWQLSRSADFDILTDTYNQRDFDYTFVDAGDTYVRLITNNAAGTCALEGKVYRVSTGESRLEIPNAFSPHASPGVNDLWKVSYRSLTSFDCHVFNRWGTCVFSTTDPAAGWDGYYRGRAVPAGAYYYVIKATGADGVRYERSGSINIIDYTAPTVSSESTE